MNIVIKISFSQWLHALHTEIIYQPLGSALPSLFCFGTVARLLCVHWLTQETRGFLKVVPSTAQKIVAKQSAANQSGTFTPCTLNPPPHSYGEGRGGRRMKTVTAREYTNTLLHLDNVSFLLVVFILSFSFCSFCLCLTSVPRSLCRLS